jgi:hypothetical protein
MTTEPTKIRLLMYHTGNHCWKRIETQFCSYLDQLVVVSSRTNVEHVVQKYRVDRPHEEDLVWLEGGQTRKEMTNGPSEA